jgi:hypothetical protein
MSMKSLRDDAKEAVNIARLKVETTYVSLVEAGTEATAKIEKEYLEAIDELNGKLAEAKELAGKAKVFFKAYGKYIVIGGLIVIAIIGIGWIGGYFSA